MEVLPQAIEDVLLVKPKAFGDHRGFFLETFQAARYLEAGIPAKGCGPFVQDNVSRSRKGILRGLHLQHPHGQGKLVQVVRGAVFDVAVDVRVSSPTFGQWVGAELTEENHHQLWIPPGFAHGFLVTSEDALFAYKCTDTYHPEAELSVRWDDPAVGVAWPDVGEAPALSEKDAAAPLLSAIPEEKLPTWEGRETCVPS